MLNNVLSKDVQNKLLISYYYSFGRSLGLLSAKRGIKSDALWKIIKALMNKALPFIPVSKERNSDCMLISIQKGLTGYMVSLRAMIRNLISQRDPTYWRSEDRTLPNKSHMITGPDKLHVLSKKLLKFMYGDDYKKHFPTLIIPNFLTQTETWTSALRADFVNVYKVLNEPCIKGLQKINTDEMKQNLNVGIKKAYISMIRHSLLQALRHDTHAVIKDANNNFKNVTETTAELAEDGEGKVSAFPNQLRSSYYLYTDRSTT